MNFASSQVSGISCSHCEFPQRHQPDPLAPLGASYLVLWVCTSIPSWLGCLLAWLDIHATPKVCVSQFCRELHLCCCSSSSSAWPDGPPAPATLQPAHAWSSRKTSAHLVPHWAAATPRMGEQCKSLPCTLYSRALLKTSLCLPSSSGRSNSSPVFPVGSLPYRVGQPCDQMLQPHSLWQIPSLPDIR